MEYNAAWFVKKLQLLPHPEGGYYKETYRSGETVSAQELPARFSGDRNFSSAIYFLLQQGNFSAFHRIQSDECWHFYAGDPLLVHMIHPDGKYELVMIGQDVDAGNVFQYVVPAGCWFASETAENGKFSLAGCTVAPGFDFSDFELADKKILCTQFPVYAELISRLSR